MKISVKSIIYTILVLALFFLLNILMDSGIIDGYYSGIIMIVCVNVILAVSLNLITGFTGQLCLGHAGFMAVGAYSSAIITAKFELPFIVAIFVSGVAASLIALVVGIPTLKLKGDYFAITTLGVGEVIRGALVNIDYVGGPRGFRVPMNTTFTWSFFLMVITILVIYNIIHSVQGRNMIAIRENEIAAEAMGVNTAKYKVMAFITAAFFAGIAGALYAHYNGFIDPPTFNFLKSVEILTFVVLGGMGSLTGSIIAAVILTFLPEVFREFQDFRMIVYSLSLILLMLFRPKGLMGTKELSFKFLDNILKKDKV
ncbi:branched-chain amino acid ABC transporter permease [Clostridium sp. SYSU_GA19001]|uniref:branched-chain amino acid ABC transporter permease n=1 Tax=Clostridium caldaquaticum TaxID=2940653 RepID=UPI0020771C00|nr:branched-chain amino acid ABC transporter permease [Clostridium caldaquaticum]MCM8709800.1 branched-chain amino acid ABC transporter permease [Clostridium caldaquaticum]